MRRHAALMANAFSLAQTGTATEEQRQDFEKNLTATFNDAQSAWDAYRDHLMGHGLLRSKT